MANLTLASGIRPRPALLRPSHAAWALTGLALAFLLVSPRLVAWMPPFLADPPKSALVPLADWLGKWLVWLAREARIGPVAVSSLTRGLAALLDAPANALNVLLTTGLRSGTGANVHTVVPPLSWLAVLGLGILAGHAVGGRRLALLVGGGLFYIVVFGLWPESMMTVASVVLSALLSAVLGLGLGAAAYAKPRLKRATEAVLNVMQTVPVFSYLVPTLLFLGYGPSAALVATVVYALPPMVHAAMLGLASTPAEIVELGRMTGASKRQMFWKIRVPAAMPLLSIGLNQAIMACLNMVIIASMIGSGGLGYLVLVALRRLDIGAALQAGLAIVVLAVILDRLSQAAAARIAAGRRLAVGDAPYARWALLWLVAATLLALALPFLQSWPTGWTLTTAPFWNGLVSWINVTFFTPLDAVRSFTLIHLMNPLKRFLLEVPWTVAVALLALAGWRLGGWRLALSVAGFLLFILLTGFWAPAAVSVYLVGLGAALSLLVGLPLGFVLAARPRWRGGADLVLDTLQTLPTLVYILPAVMLFRNGDFSAVLAIVLYAVAPAVRYSMHGFANVPETRVEAGRMCGATPWQLFKWVRLPAAFPTLLLGVNQTAMMAIAMLVITALVGTRDLGQQVYMALSRMKVGDGIVGGLCVAALALCADALIRAAAARAAARQGKA